MEQGYLLDESYGKKLAQKWVEGAPDISFWIGLKLRGKRQLEIASYRCRSCGFLESYAAD